MNEWISVKDRLPELPGYYWVSWNYNGIIETGEAWFENRSIYLFDKHSYWTFPCWIDDTKNTPVDYHPLDATARTAGG